jgi:replicative DNA helicase Mcm
MTSLTTPEERLQDFLRIFKTDSGKDEYRRKLAQMAIKDSRSLIIDFEDLISFDSSLAREIIEKPDEFLEYLERAAMAQLKVEDPEYAEQIEKINVRFSKLPEKVSLRSIGSEHMGKLIMLDGIVVRSTPVKPLLTEAIFKCRRCDTIIPVQQNGLFMRGPGACSNCKNKLFEFMEKGSKFINSQELRIQEKPEDLPPGQLPRSIDINITDDLVDIARPGDRVSIPGIIRVRQELIARGGKSRTFNIFTDANQIDVIGKEAEVIEITPEEESEIIELSKDPWLHRKLIRSIAPSIYGYDDLKESILYLLFGGITKQLPDGVTIRGDINTLLVGDPGTAKSQLLQYVARVAPRGLYTSGRGSTAAGLTAAVVREKTGGFVLEAGALVLADKGVCAIDEIDKMRPEDRVAIHEAMEQQTVSIAKGGIVATLNARSAVLAAANPTLGRYDLYKNLNENIKLPVTILSRFDLIFIMKDIPEAEMDAKMSEHILELHKLRSSPEEAPIAPELLRKYISYAKKIDPVLSNEAMNELKNFYLTMRSDSESTDSPIAITPRQLEALIRLSEARAKAFLRDEVNVEDTKAVIRLMTVSLQDVGIDTSTGKMDIDVIMTGRPKSQRDKMQAIISLVATLEKDTGSVEENTLYQELSTKHEIEEGQAKVLINQLIKEGVLYSPKPGYVRRTSV